MGIDPHPGLLARWGHEDDAAGVERFGRDAVAALAGHVAVVKPQVALFEVHGSGGVRALVCLAYDPEQRAALEWLESGQVGRPSLRVAEEASTRAPFTIPLPLIVQSMPTRPARPDCTCRPFS